MLILNYDITQVLDDTDYQVISENLNKYLEEEKKYLEEKNIKVLNVDVENCNIEIDLKDENKINDIMYKKIPFIIYNFNEIMKEKSKPITDKNLNLKTKVILSYFKENNIIYGNIKRNLIEFSCFYPGCMKTNNKSFIFIDSFFVMSVSKTDCCNEEHYKFYKEIQKELQQRYNQLIDLDKEFIKWNTNYVIIKYVNEAGDKKQTTLKEYFKRYEDDENKPKINEKKVIMCIENVKKLLIHYNIEIKFNIITKDFNVYQYGKLSRYNLDYWVTKIQDKFDLRMLRITREKLTKILALKGLNKECNPFFEYLEDQYKKDEFPDDKEFKKLLSFVKTDSPNMYTKIKKFLLQSITLACRDEYANDSLRAAFILLLHGKQSSFKTSFAEFLLPTNLKNYFYEAKNVDVNNKDRIYENATKLIVELGEIHSTFKKSDVDSFKAYITSIYDLLRRPYDREHSKFKRRVCFIGTTNNHDYIQDTTGSRRFVSLNNFEFNLKEAQKNINMDKIWSWIYYCYKQGENFWFNNEELEVIQQENSNYMYKTEEYIVLEKYFNLRSKTSEGYKIKDCWNYISEKLEVEEKILINSYMKLSKCFMKYNVNFKYDSKSKTNIWYLDFLINDSPAKSELPPKDNNIIEFKNEKPEKKDL